GVLLDIAGQQGVEALPKEFAITPEMFERAEHDAGVKVGAGDVVLIRTGWANYWSDDHLFLRQTEPGPELAGGRWLSERKVFAAGSDTICFERVPSQDMPVHVHLLVENGIHIMEALNMEALARDGVHEFLFVAVPMKIRGGTGAPVRPLAIRAKE
ncbi:MAG: cyclase family protein, partial [Acidobacteriota bacterium]